MNLVIVLFQWIGRLVGVALLGLGAVFLYWGGRGLFAYWSGVRTAPSDPLAGVAGLVAGMLGMWMGARVMRSGMPSDTLPRSDAEVIADVEREVAEHDRELNRLRDLAKTDLSSAEALQRFLVNDLAKTREAMRVFSKRGSGQLAGQFSEDEQALEQELHTLHAHLAQLRLRSGAA